MNNLGYNFPTLPSISPYLEPTAAGSSTKWAIQTALRLHCTVAVGYPEIATNTSAYNALAFVDSRGAVVAHYRKSFLFYTDEVWASEGQGFFVGDLPVGSEVSADTVKTAAGICMDINPYKFEAPWTLFEFANHARETDARLVIVSMAWLTHMGHEDLQKAPMAPDLGTVGYWVGRFLPLFGPSGSEDETVLVLANRTGEEGLAARIGEVRYAGSSCVMALKKEQGELAGHVRIWDILGRAQEDLLIVDTDHEAKFRLGKAEPVEEEEKEEEKREKEV